MPPARGDKDRKGLYATLGCATDADESEIRKAYRRLALRWHPDKNPDNPDATAEFQKISAAYEVLSDEDRRQMYDSTGCIDQEELDEGDGMMRASDIFASFFGGGFGQDLDTDEQAMMDEFLRMSGGCSFGGKGRSRRKGGRGGRSKAATREQAMFGEMAFIAAMQGGLPAVFEPVCAKGHGLKKRKAAADEGYECDVCSSDIKDGKRFFDCRKCDFSMCTKCCKTAEAEAAANEEECEEAEVFEAFCEMHIKPQRQGNRLRFGCEICGSFHDSEEKASMHMAEEHAAEIEAVAEQIRSESTGGASSMGGPGMGMPGGMDLGSLFMAASMEDMFGGGMGGGLGGMPKACRSRKKKF